MTETRIVDIINNDKNNIDINNIVTKKEVIILSIRSDAYLSFMRLILGLYILKILQQGPTHGNKLAEEIKRRTQNTYTPNTNALYPLLRALEEKGHIVGQWDSPTTRNKRIYTITEFGIARVPALEAMLQDRIKLVEVKMEILRTDLLGQQSLEQ